MDPAREKELVLRAQNDAEAFGEIFDLHYERILAYALKRTGDADVAADIAAEVFAKALKNIRRFTWRGIPLAAWLYRIAGNEVHMFYRKGKYAPSSLNSLTEAGYDPEDPALYAERRSLEEMLSGTEDEKRLLEALSTLTRYEQDLIALRYFEGYKSREIAERMKKPEGTVRSMLSRTLAELRKAYEALAQQKGKRGIISNEGRSGLVLQITEL